MYLKWLIDRNGNRVTEAYFLSRLGLRVKPLLLLDEAQEVLKRNGWKFIPCTGFRTLSDALEYTRAVEIMKYNASK